MSQRLLIISVITLIVGLLVVTSLGWYLFSLQKSEVTSPNYDLHAWVVNEAKRASFNCQTATGSAVPNIQGEIIWKL